MSDGIQMDGERLRAVASWWRESLGPSVPHPEPPVSAADPVSAAALAAISGWPAIHTQMCEQRDASAAAIVDKAHTAAAVFEAADDDNAANIDASGD